MNGNIVSSLKLNGTINWRTASQLKTDIVVSTVRSIFTVTNLENSVLVRSWCMNTGYMNWEQRLGVSDRSTVYSSQIDLYANEERRLLFVLVANTVNLLSFDGLKVFKFDAQEGDSQSSQLKLVLSHLIPPPLTPSKSKTDITRVAVGCLAKLQDVEDVIYSCHTPVILVLNLAKYSVSSIDKFAQLGPEVFGDEISAQDLKAVVNSNGENEYNSGDYFYYLGKSNLITVELSKVLKHHIIALPESLKRSEVFTYNWVNAAGTIFPFFSNCNNSAQFYFSCDGFVLNRKTSQQESGDELTSVLTCDNQEGGGRFSFSVDRHYSHQNVILSVSCAQVEHKSSVLIRKIVYCIQSTKCLLRYQLPSSSADLRVQISIEKMFSRH